jgi:hypothetical protein
LYLKLVLNWELSTLYRFPFLPLKKLTVSKIPHVTIIMKAVVLCSGLQTIRPKAPQVCYRSNGYNNLNMRHIYSHKHLPYGRKSLNSVIMATDVITCAYETHKYSHKHSHINIIIHKSYNIKILLLPADTGSACLIYFMFLHEGCTK